MLNWFAKRLQELQKAKRDEQGFTLIELLVVVIIIGILAAIAIPTFLSQRSKAQDADATSAARNAATALKSESVACNGLYVKNSATGTCDTDMAFADAVAADGALAKYSAAPYSGTVTPVGTDDKNIKVEVTSPSGKKAIYTTADSKMVVQ